MDLVCEKGGKGRDPICGSRIGFRDAIHVEAVFRSIERLEAVSHFSL